MAGTPITDKAWITSLRNFGIRTANRSPLVAKVGQIEGIGDYPACATCPGGMWLVTDDLYCFCKVMKQYTYGVGRPPVIACDERELLLAEKEPESSAAPRGRR
jgi:hypothetical protein